MNDLLSRLVAVVCFAIRGTSLLFWAVVWPYELFTMKGGFVERAAFIGKNVLTLTAMVAVSAMFAYWWYGQVHFIEFNFLYVSQVLHSTIFT